MEVGKKFTLRTFISSMSTVMTLAICDFAGVLIRFQPRSGHGSGIRGLTYGADPHKNFRFWCGGTKMAGIPATVNGTGVGGVDVSMTMR